MRKWLAILLVGGFAAATLAGATDADCKFAAVPATLEVLRGSLTLAALLAPGACAGLRRAAAGVNLGEAPRPGSVRVLAGRELRRQFAELRAIREEVVVEVPERILIRPAGAAKSCAEIARFLASADSTRKAARGKGEESLNCAAAKAVPEDAPLALTRTSWNAALQRREFGIRCQRAKDCVPFLVWMREEKTPPGLGRGKVSSSRTEASPSKQSGGARLLVKAGQTAFLDWDEAGIRIVLPVTCLEGGGPGQSVRVRFKNTSRILRAEVLSDGSLRASL